MNKHPNDMTREELRELVSDMSWAALDLSQHLNFTTSMLKDEYKHEAYKLAEKMASELCNMPYEEYYNRGNVDIVMFGEKGLTRVDTLF